MKKFVTFNAAVLSVLK